MTLEKEKLEIVSLNCYILRLVNISEEGIRDTSVHSLVYLCMCQLISSCILSRTNLYINQIHLKIVTNFSYIESNNSVINFLSLLSSSLSLLHHMMSLSNSIRGHNLKWTLRKWSYMTTPHQPNSNNPAKKTLPKLASSSITSIPCSN